MSKPDVWMPLYVADYLADTGHLRVHEHGAYLLMLMHYWRNGPLPDDDRFLSGLSRMSSEQWAECASTLRAFFEARDGKLHQKRMNKEMADAAANSAKKRDAANQRWAGHKRQGTGGTGGGNGNARNADGDARADADASPPHVQTQCPSPSPSPKEEEREASASLVRPPKRPNGHETGFAMFYSAYPRKQAKDKAHKAWLVLMRRGVDPDEILTGLRRHQFPDDPQFIPLPASWLNAGRWKDEPVGVARNLETAAERRIREGREHLRRLALGDDDEPPIIDMLPERMMLQ